MTQSLTLPKRLLTALIASVLAFALMAAISPQRANAADNNTALFKYQVYSQTNAQRSANKLSTLAASPRLDKIAQDWANHLAATSEWRHNPNVFTQVRSVGTWTLVGENLAAGYADGNSAVVGWMNSSGHRANILGKYNRIGIGIAYGGKYGIYYVQVFGNVTSSAGSETSSTLYAKPKTGNNPTSNMDSVKVNSNGTITVSGWTFDKDVPQSSTKIAVYIDGKGYSIPATNERADVKKKYSSVLKTTKVGFNWTSPVLKNGNHTVKVAAINLGQGSNSWFYNKTAKTNVEVDPKGKVESASGYGSKVTVSGWTFDPSDKSKSISVHVYIDGKGYNAGATTGARADVKKVYGLTTDKVGFNWSSPTLSKGKHRVRVYSINIGEGADKLVMDTTISVK